MAMRKAILFGAGAESVMLVKKYKHENPLILTVIGKEDSVHPDVIRVFAKYHGLNYRILKNSKGFTESWNWIDCCNQSKLTNYWNPFYKYAKRNNLILVSGRRLEDMKEKLGEEYKNFPEKNPEIENMIFPFWHVTMRKDHST